MLEDRVRKQVEQAHLAHQHGHDDYVIEVATRILRASPGCLPVRRLLWATLGRRRSSRGRLVTKALGSLIRARLFFGPRQDASGCLATADACLLVDPASVPAWRLLAEAAARLDFPETAVFAWECLREFRPEDRRTQLGLGEAYLLAGKAAEALAVADVLLHRYPQDAEVLTLMRKASIAQTTRDGNWESTGSFRTKLKDESRAVSLEQAAKVINAEDMARRLLDEARARRLAEPANLNHHRSVVEAYRRLGDTVGALAALREARTLPAGAADPGLEKQQTDLELAEMESRLREAEAAQAVAPDSVDAAQRCAQIRTDLVLFRLREARTFAEKYPNDFGARYTLGSLYLESGDFQAAIACFQQAQKHPGVRLVCLVGLGRALKARRMYDLAAAQFVAAKEASAGTDDLAKEILYELGSCYEALGRPDEAIAEFKRLYSADVGFRDVAVKINAYYAADRAVPPSPEVRRTV